MTSSAAPTMGVEEEYFLVDPASRTPQPAAAVARAVPDPADLICGEFTRYQAEVKTPPCTEAARLRSELSRLRAVAAAAATAEGVQLCASGTPVLAECGPPLIGDHPRYRAGWRRSGPCSMTSWSARCTFHLSDRELAVWVSNHLRPWLRFWSR